MIKLIALTVTLAAFAVSSSFADCGGGSCGKDGSKKDKKKDDGKSQMTQVVNF